MALGCAHVEREHNKIKSKKCDAVGEGKEKSRMNMDYERQNVRTLFLKKCEGKQLSPVHVSTFKIKEQQLNTMGT